MKFINPKTDYAFKKIFSSDDSQDILISFLNAIVYQGQPVIASLEIIDPYAPGRISALKNTYFDVKAKLNNGQNVLIEMQAFNVPAFTKRIAYNTAKAYANQLKIGEEYLEVRPLISLAVMDFTLFEVSQTVISQFIFKEKHQLFDYPEYPFELVFVELPKFKKTLEELESITDKWLYFLRKAPDLEIVPQKMAIVPEIDKAFAIANRINLSVEELDDLEKREQFVREQKGSIEFSREKGREEGLVEGIQTGQLTLVQRLLRRRFGEITDEILNRLEQLSSDDLMALGDAIFDFSSLADLVAWLETK
ncbi:Rpn family recombination-promoting nuclease/putative transposase [Argonema galeatum]|uniref:Rpn family recombination-promoting nuclease/putative transposase n=1 Tax=Argonema galeatum TaxID=2942762 RepID=UPI0020136D56|nr:Rpn family recombination-promoting nuclease/putative transposase [Argonema galeatum]MCL1462921.1 Rpn family recombination-promoting nuclease/putative transposase [Argonema galeatum A003/A1]